MPKITVFSLDYDNCGDVLFDDGLIRPDYNAHRNEIMQTRKTLENLFRQLTKQSQHVELYVGSNRQTQSLNQRNKNQNKNGDCFINYSEYCQKMKWAFRPLLFADTTNQQPAGSAMVDHKLTCDIDSRKYPFLKNQIEDIAKNHSSDEVDFYFLDDDQDDEILPWLKTQFMQYPFANNIRIHLIKFDWVTVIEDKIKHTDITTITRKETTTDTTHQCSTSTIPLATESTSEKACSFWNRHKKDMVAASGLILATAAMAYGMINR